MVDFAEVRFKGSRRGYFSVRNVEVEPGRFVVVEADRGEDVGEVTALGAVAERSFFSHNPAFTSTAHLACRTIRRGDSIINNPEVGGSRWHTS